MAPEPGTPAHAVFAAARREERKKRKQKLLDAKYEEELLAHQEMLRVVLEAHREGLNEEEMMRGLDTGVEEELVLQEKVEYEPIQELCSKRPPAAVQGESGWIYHSTSFACLRPEHPLRYICIWIVESPPFEPLVLITIVCNCISMAMASPLDEPGTDKQLLLSILEPIYLYIFTFEMLTKMVAYGIVMHKHSYLRDAWCQLDFVVVTLAWLPILFPQYGNLSAIRSVRAVRPLRALKRVPGMPVLVSSILKALPALGNVGLLTLFVFVIFGIIGMNLFKGVLHYRCADPGVLDLADHRRELSSSLDAAGGADMASALLASAVGAAHRALKGARVKQESTHPEADFDRGTLCHADPSVCLPAGQLCYYFEENPGGGTISFDSVANAMLPILQAITFDTWSDPMFDVMEAYHFSSWLYFVVIAILGGLFLVNLFLAVIFDEFMRAQQADEAEREVSAGVPRLKSKASEDLGMEMPSVMPAPEGNPNAYEAALLIKEQRMEREDYEGDNESLGCWDACCQACCACTPSRGGWRGALDDIMTSNIVNNVSTGFVVFNLMVMCMPYAGQPLAWEILTEGLSEFVTWIFIVEMILKMIGGGCRKYWSDQWNVIDGVIVNLSIGEMLITVLLADTGINISFLRMLRLLRLLRLLKAWPGLFKIVMAFVNSIPQIANLFMLMLILMFIFALLGMQIFGGTPISVDSRWHFDYFFPSMLTVFNIFTGGWVDAFQACSDEMGVLVSAEFFLPTLIIGFFIILNLFVAILLEAFASDEEEEEEEDKEKVAEEKKAAKAALKAEGQSAGLEGVSLNIFGPESAFRQHCLTIAEAGWFDAFIIWIIIASSICLALDVPRLDPTSELKGWLVLLNEVFTVIFILEMAIKVIALGFISTPKAYLKQPWNMLDFGIVLISILGLLASFVPAFGRLKALRILRVLRPLRLLQRNPGMKLIILSLVKTLPSVIEVTAVVLVFHVIFAILGMQLFSDTFGACSHPEFTTREECLAQAAAAGGRALAAIGAPDHSWSGALGAVAGPLDHLAPSALNASVILPAVPLLLRQAVQHTMPSLARAHGSLSKWWASSPLGDASTDAAAGEMHAELQSEAEAERRRKVRRGRKLLADRQTEMFDGGAWRQRDGLAAHRSGRALKGGGGEANTDDVPIEWLNPPFGSFDNFGSSMIILYIASTGDIWEEFLWAGMDARGAGIAPERNDSSAASAFFLAWMIVGAFISINLFVGAIVDNFTRIKKDSDGSATMTPEQQQWADAVRSMAANKAQKAAREPSWAPRRWVFMLVHSKGFEASVMTVIGLNVFGMALDYHKIEDDVSFHDNYVNGMMFFTYFYYAECITKLFALGHAYFNDNWCRFDFFLVCTSLLDQFASELLHSVLPMPPTLLRVLRVLRVLRILRLLKNLKGLRDLVFTLILAFPGLINVGALLLLVMFIYAVLGMNIFTFVMHGDVLNDNKNFETFGSACLVLFQCLTCDGWSEFMDDLLVDEHRGCDPNASPSDCGTPLSLPFFISWTVIGSFVFLNLIVAVILEHFTALGNVNPDLVSSNDIADFKDAWAAFDPDADGWIPAKSLPQLIRALKAPIGIGDTKDGATHAKAVKFCIRLGITSKDGQVQFREVLDALLNKNCARLCPARLRLPCQTLRTIGSPPDVRTTPRE